jgi:hypothetical protein
MSNSHSQDSTEQIRVAVPTTDSHGECYHAPGGPCGSHRLRNVEMTVADLRDGGLSPCSNCVKRHGLPAQDREAADE